MSPGALRVLRAVAAGVVVTAAGLAAYLAELYPSWGPLLVPITTAIGGAVGHTLGVPIRSVLEQALRTLNPEAKEEITRNVLKSMSPPMAARVMSSVAPPSIVFERESMMPPTAASERAKDGH